MAPGVDRQRPLLLSLTVFLAAFALALHLPGQVSFDSSIQLLEAQTGISRSWNPPFMSALLQWLGGGSRAMSIFVVACTLLTYGGLALAIGPVTNGLRAGRWRLTASVLVLANPVIVLYVGIIWKDVLFAALLCFACGATLATARMVPGNSRTALAVLAGVSLVLASHVRQQGLFLLPLLVLCPLFALSRESRPGAGTMLAWLVVACALFLALELWTDKRITHHEGHDRSRGVQRMLAFDILGTAAFAETSIPGTEAAPETIRNAYSPARIDTLSREPSLGHYFRSRTQAELGRMWLETVLGNPMAFVRHRAAVAAKVLNVRDLDQCLPVHVGIDGEAEVLARAGLHRGVGPRARWLYRFSLPLQQTPWFRHWATLCALITIAWAARDRRDSTMRVIFWFAGAMCAYVAATTVLAIACDFRYLYPAIAVGSACALALLGSNAAMSRDR